MPITSQHPLQTPSNAHPVAGIVVPELNRAMARWRIDSTVRAWRPSWPSRFAASIADIHARRPEKKGSTAGAPRRWLAALWSRPDPTHRSLRLPRRGPRLGPAGDFATYRESTGARQSGWGDRPRPPPWAPAVVHHWPTRQSARRTAAR